jgi:outer membrane protein
MSIVDKSSKIRKYVGTAIAGITMLLSQQVSAQNSFTLKDAIKYGLQNHPSVTVARNNVANAKQAAREATAGYLPQVNVNAEFDNNMKLQQSIIPAGGPFGPEERRLSFGNFNTSTAVVQADQPIYNQSLITGLKANKPNQEIAQLNKAQTKENIIYNISSSYFQIITLQKQLELLKSNKERMEKLLKVAQLQADAGVAKKVDVKQVRVNLNNVASQISVAENNLQVTMNSLRNAMGIYENVPITLTDTAKWLANKPQAKPAAGFQFDNTISYKLQSKQIELYDINAKSIQAKGLPVVSAFARYGLNGYGTHASDVLDRQLDYSAVGIKLSWNLFDGFRRNSQYHQAIIQRDNAKLNQEISQASQNLQYQNAESQYKEAQGALDVNLDNVALASQVYDNTGLQYKEGVGTLSDLLNAEQSYRDAQNNYLQSLIRYYMAQLDLERANSTLEDYFNKL